MHPLETLHQTLRMAGLLLDLAATQVREASLAPVRENLLKVGTALAELSELRLEIDRIAPELKLEPRHEKSSPEDSAANRRLGNALLIADDLDSQGKHSEAIASLENFARGEPSETHRAIARTQAENYRMRTEP